MFVTYSLCFMTLLVVTAVLIGLSGLPQIAGFAMLIPPFHMYRQLKGTYGLSRGGALVRTILLVAFSIVALGLFFLALFGLGPLRLAAAGIFLLEDPEHRRLERHGLRSSRAGMAARPSMNSYEPSFARALGEQ